MRVLVVTTWFPTAASPSTGVFVARDVEAVAQRHDVRVLHLCAPALLGSTELSGASERTDPGVVVERVPMDPRRPDHVARAAARVRRASGKADLVHTMAVSALLPMTGWRPRAPWVHTEHWSGLLAPQTLTPALRAARPVVLRMLRRPDVVAVVSEHLATGVRKLRTGPVVVVPNIVEGPDRLTSRHAAGVPLTDHGPLEIVAVGGLVARKDPLTAVDTVAELRRRGVDARLTWVGDGPLREATAHRGETSGIPLTLTGPVPPGRVQELVAGADLFLLPTRAETFCVAAAEALAAGRPVVVGDSGGPRDFVAPPSGRLVTPGAPAGRWADAVEEVWADCAELSAGHIAAPVGERFGAQAYAERVDAVYHRLVGGVVDGRDASAAEPDAPLVDVVIATHSAQRMTERAVRSVLDGTSAGLPVRVTVVCHDLPVEEVAASLSEATLADPRVRLLHHVDGVPSPAGPFTAGLEAATAPWLSIMGSDDHLEPGAVEGWLAVARETGAEVVLTRLVLTGAAVATPPTRIGRTHDLDLVADRLAYRSAPLGLLSRAAVERSGARMLPGAQTGEDVPFSTRLYAQARVALAGGAAYRVGTEAADRTTYVARPIRDQLGCVEAILDDPWWERRPAGQRRAVATKLLRIHVFGAVGTRTDPEWWRPEERAELARITRRLLDEVPGCARPLSLSDHDLIGAIVDTSVPAERLLELAEARRRHGSPRTLVPADLRATLDPEAPLRFMAASLAASRR